MALMSKVIDKNIGLNFKGHIYGIFNYIYTLIVQFKWYILSN